MYEELVERLKIAADWAGKRAECKKHDLVTDFYSHKKLNTLKCVDGNPPKEE